MNHKDMEVWKKSIELVTDIYTITRNFPNDEMCGIVNQMRRCAVSIPSNIAEGCSRFSDKETLKFLSVSLGSISELETQLIISNNVGYLDDITKLQEQLESVKKITNYSLFITHHSLII